MSTGLEKVDTIDDITEAYELFQSFGLSTKGLYSLDQMKNKLREHLKGMEGTSSRKIGEASTILLEARAENTRKREELLSLFSRAKDLLNDLNTKEKESRSLTPDRGIIRGTMEHHIRQLEQENFHILVAGETGAGKTSLINLILGEEVLPSEFLASTSTICELKYGKERKFVLHYKEADPSKQRRQSVSYKELKEFSKYVGGANERKGSIYEKIEIYWPHKLLENGIAIVDSPGIGDEESMDEMVTQYLTQAFAFVYVIDTSNSGGVNKNRIEKLLQDTMTKVFEKGSKDLSQGSQNAPLEHEFQSNCALFLCNKWDVVRKNKKANPDKVKEEVIKKLKNCWPGLVTEDQVFFMSVEEAKLAEEYGRVSADFENFVNSMGSMILNSCKTRLEIHWRWLYHFLSWISYRATSFLVKASREKDKVHEEILVISRRLDTLKAQQSKDLIDLRRRMDNTVHEAVQTLMEYLKSEGVRERLLDWTQDEILQTFEEVANGRVDQLIQKKLRDVVDEWEKDQFKVTKEYLMRQIRHRFDIFEGELRSLRGNVTGGFPNVPGIDPIPGRANFLGQVVVKISWFFHNCVFPFTRFLRPGFLPSDPQASWEHIERRFLWWWSNQRDIMKKLSERYLSEVLKESVLTPFVKGRLQEAEQYLSHIQTLVPEQIEADKRLLAQLSGEKRSEGEIIRTYRPILDGTLNIQEKVAFFGLREAGVANICSERLDWNQGSYILGAGEFSTVYQGKMTRHGEEQAVALKVFQEVPLAKNASRIIQEANQLSKLDHPHFVKFYGTAVVDKNEAVKAVLVMELCKGNLKNHFKFHQPSVPGLNANRKHVLQACKWVIEICSALDYIHNERVVHRDLKLKKILLSEDNTVKLYDVSVCKEVDSISGKFKGTPRYMAPEVLRSELNDSKADIYSFGIVLWEIWFGRRAFADIYFDSSDPQDFFNLVCEGSRPKDVEDLKKPPRLWKELMEKCWDGDPKKRPTAKECEQIVTKLSSEWSG